MPLHACTHVSRYPCFQAREHTYTHTPLLLCTPCPMRTFILEQDSWVLQAVVWALPLWLGATLASHPLSGRGCLDALCGVLLSSGPASPYSILAAPGQWLHPPEPLCLSLQTGAVGSRRACLTGWHRAFPWDKGKECFVNCKLFSKQSIAAVVFSQFSIKEASISFVSNKTKSFIYIYFLMYPNP